MKFQISNFAVMPLKNSDCDIAFYSASFILNNSLFVNGVRLIKNGTSYQVEFPEIKVADSAAPVLFPVNISNQKALVNAIVEEFEQKALRYYE